MKKIINFNNIFLIVTILIVGFSFVGCEKDPTLTENLPQKKIVNNPYDIFGQYHNEAMQIIYDSAKTGKPINISVFACDFTAHKMSINTHYDYKFWFDRFLPCMDLFNNQFLPFYKDFSDLDFSSNFFNSLTDYQRKYLCLIFRTMDTTNSESEFFKSLKLIEQIVLTDVTAPEWEKGVVLGTISIAKYSFAFVITHFPKDRAPRWLEKVKNVAKADAVGFVGGAIASVLDGHAAAATMTFGPQGTVAVVAGEATMGAIINSGTVIVGEVVNQIVND